MSYNLSDWAKEIADAIRYQNGNDESYKIKPYNFPLEIEALFELGVDVTNGELTNLPELCKSIANAIRSVCWCEACLNGDAIAPVDFASHIKNIVYEEEEDEYCCLVCGGTLEYCYNCDTEYCAICSSCNCDSGDDTCPHTNTSTDGDSNGCYTYEYEYCTKCHKQLRIISEYYDHYDGCGHTQCPDCGGYVGIDCTCDG